MAQETPNKDAFFATLLENSTKTLLAQLTPDVLQSLAEEIIRTALKHDLEQAYSSLGGTIRQAAEKYLQEYLATTVVQDLLKEKVREGVSAAFMGFPDLAKAKVLDLALKGVVSGIESGTSRNRY